MLILERDRKEYINAVIDINLLILHVLGISSHFLNSNSLDLWVFSNKIKHVILERSREFKSWKIELLICMISEIWKVEM